MPIVSLINILVVLVGILNALLGQPFISPDLAVIIGGAILILNAIIDVLRYFFPESALGKMAAAMRA